MARDLRPGPGGPDRCPGAYLEALAKVANATGGTAFTAATQDELKKVYEDIGSDVGHETEEQEVTYRAVSGHAGTAGPGGARLPAVVAALPLSLDSAR